MVIVCIGVIRYCSPVNTFGTVFWQCPLSMANKVTPTKLQTNSVFNEAILRRKRGAGERPLPPLSAIRKPPSPKRYKKFFLLANKWERDDFYRTAIKIDRERAFARSHSITKKLTDRLRLRSFNRFQWRSKSSSGR